MEKTVEGLINIGGAGDMFLRAILELLYFLPTLSSPFFSSFSSVCLLFLFCSLRSVSVFIVLPQCLPLLILTRLISNASPTGLLTGCPTDPA